MRERGFTLVEMIVTLMILSILALAAMPLGETVVQHSREQQLRHALSQIRRALDAFKEASDTGRIAPVSGSGYPPNLEILVEGVADARDANRLIFFLRQIPRDPFCPVELPDVRCWATRAYDTPADRPRPGDDVFDVHSRSELSGSDGRPYRRW